MFKFTNLFQVLSLCLLSAGCRGQTWSTSATRPSEFLALDIDSKNDRASLTFINSSELEIQVAGLSMGETIKVPTGFNVAIAENGKPITPKAGFEDGYWSPLFGRNESKYIWERFVTIAPGERFVIQVLINDMFVGSDLRTRQPGQQLRVRWTGIVKTSANSQKIIRCEVILCP